MPLAYGDGTVAEHRACRTAAVAFDVSHLGTVRVDGPTAFDALQGTLTNDLRRIGPGRAQYTHLLDDDGSVVDDLIVWWVDAERFDVMPNASNTARVRAAVGGDDVTDGAGRRRGPGPRCPGSPGGRRAGRGRGRPVPGHAVRVGRRRRVSPRGPGTPARTASSARCRPRWRRRSGTRCFRPASDRPGSAPATRSAWRPDCRSTATSWARGSRRCRPGSAGSSAGTRATSAAGPRSRRSGPTVRDAGSAGSSPTAGSRRARGRPSRSTTSSSAR